MRHPIAALILTATILAGSLHLAHCQELPTPHAIIDRALKAGGGVEKIRQFTAVSFKGSSRARAYDVPTGAVLPLSGLFAGPTLFRLELDAGKEGNMIWFCTGDTVWDGVKTKKKLSLYSAVFYGISLPDQLLTLKSKDYKLTILGAEAVKGRECIKIRVDHKEFDKAGYRLDIFFDKATHLPVKTQWPQLKDGALPEFEAYFDDYKEFAGVRHFTKLKLQIQAETFEIDIRELKLHRTYHPGWFKKPG